MIDLHMHTTASDGRCSPGDLVNRAFARGIRVMSVTDHDTMAAVRQATAAASALGMTCIPGIEITCVQEGRDVHILAYFLSDLPTPLDQLIAAQRQQRIERARTIAARLAAAGAPIDIDAVLRDCSRAGGKSIARPQIAAALMDAGHVASVAEAFDRFLGEDGPAYVPHHGPPPAQVVELINEGGGLASLAHPGPTNRDQLIAPLVNAGLGAIEAYHSAHDEPTCRRYVDLARRLGLAISGGSDYHGEGTRRSEFFGVTHLPPRHFEELRQRGSK